MIDYCNEIIKHETIFNDFSVQWNVLHLMGKLMSSHYALRTFYLNIQKPISKKLLGF